MNVFYFGIGRSPSKFALMPGAYKQCKLAVNESQPHRRARLGRVVSDVPPRVSDWPNLIYDTNAPLSKWQQGGSFDTAKECEEGKKEIPGLMLQTIDKMPAEEKQKAMQSIMTMLSEPQCIATDDPRLKEK